MFWYSIGQMCSISSCIYPSTRSRLPVHLSLHHYRIPKFHKLGHSLLVFSLQRNCCASMHRFSSISLSVQRCTASDHNVHTDGIDHEHVHSMQLGLIRFPFLRDPRKVLPLPSHHSIIPSLIIGEKC